MIFFIPNNIFAFGFLVRNDMILGIIPIFGLLLFELKYNNKKIQKFMIQYHQKFYRQTPRGDNEEKQI